DSLQIALESKVEATARARYDLALECFHQLVEIGLPPEIEAKLRGYVEEMVARFPTAWRVNVAKGLLERAEAARRETTREERLGEARAIVAEGLASDETVDRSELEALAKSMESADPATALVVVGPESEGVSAEDPAQDSLEEPADALAFVVEDIEPPQPEIDVELGALASVHLAMLQERRAGVHSLKITNRSAFEATSLELEVTSEPAFVRPSRIRIDALEAGGVLDLGPRRIASFLSHDASVLTRLSERAGGEVVATVRGAGGVELARAAAPWVLFPTDTWFGLGTLPELLASYVLPNDPAVDATMSLVAQHLGAASGSPSIDGYQSKDPVRALRIVEAVYAALRDAEVTYANPPASFEDDGQRVRFPGKVISTRLGTCLDLALFAAAVLEQAGLHPILMVTEGHAFVGTWLVEETYPSPVVEEPARVFKRVELSEIVVFDPTLVSQRPSPDFEGARAAAQERLQDPSEFRAAIDVQRARLGGVLPLPTLEAGVHGDADAIPQEDAAPTRSARDLDEELRVYLEAERLRREEDETPETRLDRWLRQLLDLTMRNRLLNSASRSKRIIPLVPGDLGSIEDRLADGKALRILERPVELEGMGPRSTGGAGGGKGAVPPEVLERIRPLLDAGVQAGELRSWLTASELDDRLLTLYREARTAREEGGAGALYLAVGFLVYTETKESSKARRAPLLLIPLELKRKSARRGYSLVQGADEPRANVTLLEYLRRDHQIDVTGLDPLPTDEQGIDVPLVLRIFKDAVKDVDGWEVVAEAEVGLYSFAKYLLWRDLKDRANVLRRNELVAHLIERPSEPFPARVEVPDPATLDESFSASEVLAPLSYDSSQLSAILAAAEGKTMVLEGPPGTGKSQTITNLIAHAIAQGKTVLFVSEKMAALDVVHRRLRELGLGPACLELHSNKANKKAVLEQFRESLEEGRVRGSRRRAWEEIAGDLDERRAELNVHVDALHRTRVIGESMHDVLGRLSAKGAPGARSEWDLEADLGVTSPRDLDAAKLAAWRALLDEIDVVAAKELVGPAHPLLLVGQTEYSPIFEAESLRSVRGVEEPADEFLSAAELALEAAGAGELSETITGEAGWQAFGSLLAKAAVDHPGAGSAERWLQDPDAIQAVEACVAKAAEVQAMEARHAETFRASVATLALDEIEAVRREYVGGGFFTRLRKKGALLAPFRGIANEPGRIKVNGAIQALDEGLRLRELRREIDEGTAAAAVVLGDAWSGAETLIDGARTALGHAGELTAALSELSKQAGSKDGWANVTAGLIQRSAAAREGFGALRDGMLEALGALASAKRLLVEAADPLPGAPLSDSLDDLRALRSHAVTWADAWTDRSGGLRGWTRWQKVRASAVGTRGGDHGAGLAMLVELMERGEGCVPGELRRRFDAAFARAWALHEISADSALKAFDGPEHGRKVRDFRELDDERLSAAREEVRQRVGSRRPKTAGVEAVTGKAAKTGLGLLQREITKKTRHLAIRRLLAELGEVAMELKPCFLMSPMSVAQYLDAEHPPFDIVVFDEASQIPVWDAIGAIARGTQAVIVGDPKQLPPTSFFSRAADVEEIDEDDVEDLESILEECMGAQVPTHRLRWHYRSRHESLIAFSNARYYDGKLLTFPSGSSRAGGVRVIQHLDAVYDKGRTRTNQVEARAVAQEVVRRLRDPKHASKSVGVVTFSQAQQTLILDLLEAEHRRHPELERFFDEGGLEPVFVKNLENVQGDERDVIIFSIGYGPDASGRLSMNFGPLNNDGGERRLNVAITRAREEVLVHTSIRSDQIDLARTGARGVRDLRAFLAFAEERERAERDESAGDGAKADAGEPLAASIGERLTELGWGVEFEIGRSDVRVDLAVRHPEHPGTYVVGIETDGPHYGRAATARDRDRLRGDVLEGLGWRLLRVWAVDWWRDAEGEAARLHAEIQAILDEEPVDDAADEALMLAEPPDEDRAVDDAAEGDDPSGDPDGRSDESDPELPKRLAAAPPTIDAAATAPYAAAEVPGFTDRASEFYDDESDRDVGTSIARVLDVEAPLTEETLVRRIAAVWGFAAVSKKFRSRVRGALELLNAHVEERTIGDADVQRVLWRREGESSEYQSFRPQTSTDVRALMEIPVVEVSNAMLATLGEDGSPVALEDLQREVLLRFGVKRLTQGPRQLFGAALDDLQASGRIDIEVTGGVVSVRATGS
ncbi:MAG: DUF3320 domain-containing protein, partial [Planctomycetota bacterium]